jgi:hypothetical protein
MPRGADSASVTQEVNEGMTRKSQATGPAAKQKKESGVSQLISPSLVERLTKAGERIQRATDELNTTIVDIEAFLGNLNLGIPGAAWVETDQGPFRVAYRCDDGKTWVLLLEKIRVKSGKADGQHSAEVEASWPMKQAPKVLMLQAAEQIPNLIESIAATATAEAERIEGAVERIKGPADEITITDERTREQLDREFLDLYAKRMSEEGARA